jgi:hypothetical protein
MRGILLFALAIALSGCASELETGYKPKPLGVSSEERRAYYAPPFSPESQAVIDGVEKRPALKRPVGY